MASFRLDVNTVLMRLSCVLSLLGLAAQVSSAAVSSGGDWELAKSGFCAGSSSLDGARGAQCVGESPSSPAVIIAGPYALLSGYLSQVPSVSTAPKVLAFFSEGRESEGVLWGVPSGAALRLLFSNDMATSTLPGALTVEAVLTPSGIGISSAVSFAVDNGTWTGAVELVRSTEGWAKGYLYRLAVASSASDINGFRLGTAATFLFASVLSTGTESLAPGSGGEPLVSIPAGSYPGDYFVIATTRPAGEAITRANSKLQGIGAVGPAAMLAVSVFDASAQAMSQPPSVPARLLIPFPDSDGDGIVDGLSPATRTRKLSVWWLDETRALWVRQGPGDLDSLERKVGHSTAHFSTFALIATQDTDVSSVYAYPVPFRPNSGEPGRYGTWAGGIKFSNLPGSGRIRVYTVSGSFVRELPFSSATAVWDARNSDGSVVASGVYVWEALSGESRKTGKLVVVK